MIECTRFPPSANLFDRFRRFMAKEIAPSLFYAEWEAQGYVAREAWNKAGAKWA